MLSSQFLHVRFCRMLMVSYPLICVLKPRTRNVNGMLSRSIVFIAKWRRSKDWVSNVSKTWCAPRFQISERKFYAITQLACCVLAIFYLNSKDVSHLKLSFSLSYPLIFSVLVMSVPYASAVCILSKNSALAGCNNL